MFKILFFLILLLFHPVHVTLTSIDYIQEKDYYKVFVRMYFDDYLLDNKQNGRDVEEADFLDGNYDSRNEVEQFIREKIVIKENEESLIGKLLNMELADNEISINMEYQAKNKPKTLRVKSMIMTDLYKDQLNMVIVRVNDFEEGVKLTSDLTEHTFKIK
jgi:uncharacterized protein DUF6702